MDTYLETNAAEALATGTGEAVRQAYDGPASQPRPEWTCGECPQCGAAVVSNCYYNRRARILDSLGVLGVPGREADLHLSQSALAQKGTLRCHLPAMPASPTAPA